MRRRSSLPPRRPSGQPRLRLGRRQGRESQVEGCSEGCACSDNTLDGKAQADSASEARAAGWSFGTAVTAAGQQAAEQQAAEQQEQVASAQSEECAQNHRLVQRIKAFVAGGGNNMKGGYNQGGRGRGRGGNQGTAADPSGARSTVADRRRRRNSTDSSDRVDHRRSTSISRAGRQGHSRRGSPQQQQQQQGRGPALPQQQQPLRQPMMGQMGYPNQVMGFPGQMHPARCSSTAAAPPGAGLLLDRC